MFCVVRGKESFGIGKLIEINSGNAIIEYFTSPTSEMKYVECEKDLVSTVNISPQTRIYYNDPVTHLWKVGRVLVGEGSEIIIQFPNRERVNISTDEVYIRCRVRNEDPTGYLATFLNETPLFANSRRDFVRVVNEQRKVSRGMSGLISSVIELEPHQVEVVGRILTDPIQRYLLADEVGLGKTIEAGVVIRQYVIDCPVDHFIVIVVPSSLISQWRQELSRRFLLEQYLDDSILVLSNTDIGSLERELPKAKMLVVDEVHQVVRELDLDNPDDRYNMIRQASHEAERLLMLSATPVLGNESGFLAMLHLIDPVIYPLNGLDSFREKISKRQPLAHLISELNPDNLLFLGDTISRLVSTFPADTLLSDHARNLENLLEGNTLELNEEIKSAITAIRSHVSETYKLHRRILRNRRSRVEGLTPPRGGFIGVKYNSMPRVAIMDTLEKWRNEALIYTYESNQSEEAKLYSNIYYAFLNAYFNDVSFLKNLAEIRLSKVSSDRGYMHMDLIQAPFYPNEEIILGDIVLLADEILMETTKFEALTDSVRELLEKEKRIVIFCTALETADNVYEVLVKRFSEVVTRHKYDDTEYEYEQSDASLNGFMEDGKCKVIVCDVTAEDGLNLQGGDKVMLHYDLPLSPNRIEQRVGRLDRYGFGSEIISYGMICDNNEYEEVWAKSLSDGFGVFDRTIASLQYAIEEIMNELKNRLFNDGLDAITILTEKIGGDEGEISKELSKIDLQDQLDALHIEYNDVFEDLEDLDFDWKSIEGGTDPWVERCLLFNKVTCSVEGPISPDQVFCFQYNHSKHRDTLVSLIEFMNNFLPSIDFEAVGVTSKNPRSFPLSYRRQTAISKKVHLLRYGHPFIDGVMNFSNYDDRGQSFAVWRYTPTYESKKKLELYFRFDFLVEVNLKGAYDECQKLEGKRNDTIYTALQRLGDNILPPVYQTIWLDYNFEVPSPHHVQEHLEIEYRKRPRENGSYDININPTRWETLWKLDLPMLREWGETCQQVRENAMNILYGSINLEEIIQKSLVKARIENERYYSQINSRIAHLENVEQQLEKEQLIYEQAMRKGICDGIERPKITIDTVGVVFLSEHNPFERNA